MVIVAVQSSELFMTDSSYSSFHVNDKIHYKSADVEDEVYVIWEGEIIALNAKKSAVKIIKNGKEEGKVVNLYKLIKE